MQLGSEEHFGVGFVFSEDAAAQAITDEDREGHTEKWIMLNPFKDVQARSEDLAASAGRGSQVALRRRHPRSDPHRRQN